MPRTNTATAEVDERLGALRVESPEQVEQQLVVPPVALSQAEDRRIAELEAMVKQLSEQLLSVARQGPAKPQKDFGPPPPARKSLPFIRMMVNQFSQVIRQVPQSYIDEKRAGWDGVPVKAYQNHDRSNRKK